jgi:two-component system alkaline phosphatase synthesis response regulator PhoP
VTKVLLIEDDAATRLLIRETLEAAGSELVEAADGQVGIDLARSGQPDLILLDIGLPVLDGWQVARELLDDATTYQIPLVFLSARTDPDDRARGLRLGARDYITKPFDPDTLAARIDAILAEARERDLPKGGECPIRCVGMTEKEGHVYEGQD